MEYVYAAMLLHSAGKDIDEKTVEAVLKAAKIEVNEAKVKSLIASLDGVNIEEAIEKSVVQAAPAAPATAGASADAATKAEDKKQEEEDEKGEEEAASGLAALFG